MFGGTLGGFYYALLRGVDRPWLLADLAHNVASIHKDLDFWSIMFSANEVDRKRTFLLTLEISGEQSWLDELKERKPISLIAPNYSDPARPQKSNPPCFLIDPRTTWGVQFEIHEPNRPQIMNELVTVVSRSKSSIGSLDGKIKPGGSRERPFPEFWLKGFIWCSSEQSAESLCQLVRAMKFRGAFADTVAPIGLRRCRSQRSGFY